MLVIWSSIGQLVSLNVFLSSDPRRRRLIVLLAIRQRRFVKSREVLGRFGAKMRSPEPK